MIAASKNYMEEQRQTDRLRLLFRTQMQNLKHNDFGELATCNKIHVSVEGVA